MEKSWSGQKNNNFDIFTYDFFKEDRKMHGFIKMKSSSISEFADVAFAASWRRDEKETRVSARARKNIPIKLNEVMAKVGAQFSATGGGHAKAAGANAKEKPIDIASIVF